MLYIAVCDDEEYFLKREYSLIMNYMKENRYSCEIDTFSSGEDFLKLGAEISKYRIVFLDVNMDGIDGIETAKRLRELSENVYLVFVTAYITYSLDGYKVDAIRYILKDDDCLEQSIEESLQAIFAKMGTEERKMSFNFLEGERTIRLSRLTYVESNLHKLVFHIGGEKEMQYTMYEKLDAIDARLQKEGFCRIHQSYLVNLSYLESIERYRANLSDGTKLGIAKPRYPEVREKYISYKGDMA
ncbi:MAG: LytTR family DNA-binding domain-containing protein [Lachnospiraceae bacterium]|nr:LytTR family DNA-binding domain-containing protein [Lachnospiraceae bacterium]